MGIETVAAEQWLYSKLSGDAQLAAVVGTRVYGYRAPDGAALPYVLYQNQAARDVAGVGPARIGSSLMYLVRVVGETTTFAALQTAAARIDAVLQGAAGTVPDGEVWGCGREQPFVLVETNAGKQVRHLGGVYRVWAK
jgi:hypothetical protein